MSGLLHLVEAATVLTRLGPSALRPSTAYQAASSSSLSTSLTRTVSVHTAAISDDDENETLANTCTTMAKLRENHLQALCAAAANANATLTSTESSSAVVSKNLKSTATHHYPAAISPRDGGESAAAAAREIFPMRLHALLSDPTVRDVITWLPHGRSFVVLRPDVFATHVLPRYFAPEGSNSFNAKISNTIAADGDLVAIMSQMKGVHKYPSFTRKLNRWGFRQISRGPESGAFCHDLFQRDDPELCRGMVCQKSRKSKSALRASDDLISVSSASTMGTASKSVASNEKRRFSSMVTVSTAGVTCDKSLPLKKRKSGQHTATNENYMMNGIPSMISHRFQKMSSSSSMTESDLTSDGGSVGSNNNAANNHPAVFELKSSNVVQNPSQAQVAETLARETLALHFHEQRRAFALASLLENSRLAMNAVGMNATQASVCAPQEAASFPLQSSQSAITYHTDQVQSRQHLSSTVEATAFQPPPACSPIEGRKMACTVDVPVAPVSMADAAKMALYKAYLQALDGSSNSDP